MHIHFAHLLLESWWTALATRYPRVTWRTNENARWRYSYEFIGLLHIVHNLLCADVALPHPLQAVGDRIETSLPHLHHPVISARGKELDARAARHRSVERVDDPAMRADFADALARGHV